MRLMVIGLTLLLSLLQTQAQSRRQTAILVEMERVTHDLDGFESIFKASYGVVPASQSSGVVGRADEGPDLKRRYVYAQLYSMKHDAATFVVLVRNARDTDEMTATMAEFARLTLTFRELCRYTDMLPPQRLTDAYLRAMDLSLHRIASHYVVGRNARTAKSQQTKATGDAKANLFLYTSEIERFHARSVRGIEKRDAGGRAVRQKQPTSLKGQ